MRSIILPVLTVLSLTGCTAQVGPTQTRKDRISYNYAVQSGAQKELLLNIVRLRYQEAPSFLDIGVISSGYDFKRSASFRFEADSNNFFKYVPSIGADLSEKPTTTYQPIKGEGIVKQLMSPMNFETLLLLNSSGWRMDRIMRCCVSRLNNIKNAPTASGPTPKEAPEYNQFLDLMDNFRRLEKDDSINILAVTNTDSCKVEIILYLDPLAADQAALSRVWDMLELEPGTSHAKLTPYHGREHYKDEVQVETRSPSSILYFLSHAVEVPYWDEECGRVRVTQGAGGEKFDWDNVLGGILKIRSGSHSRSCESIFITYRGVDFYIDDRDLDSKATFSLLSQVLALQSGKPIIPALTIPLRD